MLVDPEVIASINRMRLKVPLWIKETCETDCLREVRLRQFEKAEADLQVAVQNMLEKIIAAQEEVLEQRPNIHLSVILRDAGIKTEQ